jgi:uncharacterized membrane protein
MKKINAYLLVYLAGMVHAIIITIVLAQVTVEQYIKLTSFQWLGLIVSIAAIVLAYFVNKYSY